MVVQTDEKNKAFLAVAHPIYAVCFINHTWQCMSVNSWQFCFQGTSCARPTAGVMGSLLLNST
jgi:hypothetical protein